MTDKPVSLTSAPQGYADWLADLKDASTPRSSVRRWRSIGNW